jgi:hypothetical protein
MLLFTKVLRRYALKTYAYEAFRIVYFNIVIFYMKCEIRFYELVWRKKNGHVFRKYDDIKWENIIPSSIIISVLPAPWLEIRSPSHQLFSG